MTADSVQSRPKYSQRTWKHTSALRLLLGPGRSGRGTADTLCCVKMPSCGQRSTLVFLYVEGLTSPSAFIKIAMF